MVPLRKPGIRKESGFCVSLLQPIQSFNQASIINQRLFYRSKIRLSDAAMESRPSYSSLILSTQYSAESSNTSLLSCA